MKRRRKHQNTYSSAEARWASVGPYYAMFPKEFASEIIQKYSKPNDIVLDPFAGRGTSVYYAALHKRQGVGIEINPMGWLFGKVKLSPAKKELVQNRLKAIYQDSFKYLKRAKELPRFYHYCYSEKVRSFLLCAKSQLNWMRNKTDSTLMAFILINLHGKIGNSLSNQMRQTKAMAPDYSIEWWKKNHLDNPPDINPYTYLYKRIEWRYAKGIPSLNNGKIFFGNCLDILPKIEKMIKNRKIKPFSLLLSSPPYQGITNYQYDQWLRLWLLGGDELPSGKKTSISSRHAGIKEYENFLDNVFGLSSKLMRSKSTIYIRTDARETTRSITLSILERHFPSKKMKVISRPYTQGTQTALFGDKSKKPGEIDIILK